MVHHIRMPPLICLTLQLLKSRFIPPDVDGITPVFIPFFPDKRQLNSSIPSGFRLLEAEKDLSTAIEKCEDIRRRLARCLGWFHPL